jgi:cobalt transporter subunit CbtA
MFRRILFSGCLAGLLAGLVITALQMIQVVPIILEAETYEGGGHGAGHSHEAGHSHGAQHPSPADTGTGLWDRFVAFQNSEGTWAPADGLQRSLSTALANVLTGIAFALLLSAAFSLRGNVEWPQGLLWGLAGYLVFFVLPGLGLPPEIPGAKAAALVDRQAWWLLTVSCSALGLALLVLQKQWLWKGAGAIFLALPHLLGAPQPVVHGSAAPAALAESFIWASAIANGIFWLLLGTVTAWAFKKLA